MGRKVTREVVRGSPRAFGRVSGALLGGEQRIGRRVVGMLLASVRVPELGDPCTHDPGLVPHQPEGLAEVVDIVRDGRQGGGDERQSVHRGRREDGRGA